MGSQIDKRQMNKILSYVKIGTDEGATLLCGGEQFTENGLENGCFIRPTLLGNVTNDMRVAKEEIFGPVACIIKFKSEDEVIRKWLTTANTALVVLYLQMISTELFVYHVLSRQAVYGSNTYNAIPEGAPFGGYKKSGIGRETHKVILEHYTQMKNILINLSGAPSGFYPKKD